MANGEGHKEFMKLVRDTTGCTVEQAGVILGELCEKTQSAYMQGYGRGFNQGAENERKKHL